MCGLCGLFDAGRRWLDAAGDIDPAARRRERHRRVAMIRRVLAPVRVAVDDFEGSGFVLRGATGASTLVDNLFDLWRAAETLGKRRLDPLDGVAIMPPLPSMVLPGGPAFAARSLPDRRAGSTDAATSAKAARDDASDRRPTAGRLPLHVLTGFLGSGKTTLLNRVIRQPGWADTAILINEIGAISIDHDLIERIESSDALDIVVLQGGCTCCALRGDMVAALRELHSRRIAGDIPPFARVVMETTGLADPAPILFTLVGDPMLRHKFEAGLVVTTFDAVHGLAQLQHHPESRKQAAVADRIVLTKTDLDGAMPASALAGVLHAINPAAELMDGCAFATAAGLLDAGDHRILPSAGNVLAHAAATMPDGGADGPAHHPGHAMSGEHSSDVDATSFALGGQIDWAAFAVWLTWLLHAHGDRMLRFKALLDVEGWPAPVALDGVHHMIHAPTHLSGWRGRVQGSRLVFIAQGLDVERIAPSLHAFLARHGRRPAPDATRRCRSHGPERRRFRCTAFIFTSAWSRDRFSCAAISFLDRQPL